MSQTHPKQTWKLIDKVINRGKSNECISREFKVDDEKYSIPMI